MGQTAPVVVDGRLDEWEASDVVYSDAHGDGNDPVDFGRVWFRNDDRFVYLSFEVSGIVALQTESRIRLALDTDDNAATGVPACGFGAELVWDFSERVGSFTAQGRTLDVGFGDFGLVTAPTTTASAFEMSLELDAEPRRLGLLFPTDVVRLCLEHSDGGDRLPDDGEEAVFSIDRSAEPREFPVNVARPVQSVLRLLAWNVLQDGLFEASRTNAYRRILNLIEPDVIVFSEIFDHTEGQTIARMSELVPLQGGSQWFAAAAPASVVLVSKTPIVQTVDVEPNGRAHGFVVEGPPGMDEVFIVGAHLYCCEADDRRQAQVDRIMAWIRDARMEGTLRANTPIIIAGDMNFVGDYRQPRTLIEGEIVNPFAGPSFDPDWDQSPFADAAPATTGLPHNFTWIDPAGPQDRQFSPGRLDYVVFSDAVLSEEQSFALYTPAVAFDDLQELGLLGTDTSVASDHLAVVTDFAPKNPTAIAFREAPSPGSSLVDVFPNPASDMIRVEWSSNGFSVASLEVYDALGRLVMLDRIAMTSAGRTSLRLGVADLPTGFYFVVVRSPGGAWRGKFLKGMPTI